MMSLETLMRTTPFAIPLMMSARTLPTVPLRTLRAILPTLLPILRLLELRLKIWLTMSPKTLQAMPLAMPLRLLL